MSAPSTPTSPSSPSSAAAEEVRRGYIQRFNEGGSCCGCFKAPWLRQYLVLKDCSLFFYEKPESLVPLLQISLYGAACIFAQFPKTNKPNTLEVSTPQMSVMFHVEDQNEVKQWAASIQRSAVLASGGKPKA